MRENARKLFRRRTDGAILVHRSSDRRRSAILTPAAAVALLLSLVPVEVSAAPASAGIAPHRATYLLSLAQTRAGSPVADVNGKMSFVWQDVCDGWTVEQRFEVGFFYAEGQTVEMSTSYVTWESKDGNSYRFNIRKMVNGKLDEELRGDATLEGAKGGVARYARPEENRVALLPGTIFPSAHTIELLKLAHQGETFFSRQIFDGSEAEGATVVSAVMGRKKKLEGAQVDTAGLMMPDAWPIHLAFFPADRQEYLPDYETSLMLLDNGIVQSMVIDYGDFKVNAKLESLEPVPRPPC